MNCSDECKDFITRLLDKNPKTRLGSEGGVQEIMAHPWLKSVDQELIFAKAIDAPYKPPLSANPCDVQMFDETFTQEEAAITAPAF
jgi:serine/threonine protein kinase